jgi:hypothetical protein
MSSPNRIDLLYSKSQKRNSFTYNNDLYKTIKLKKSNYSNNVPNNIIKY